MNAHLSWMIGAPDGLLESSASEEVTDAESLSSVEDDDPSWFFASDEEDVEEALRIHRSGQNLSGFEKYLGSRCRTYGGTWTFVPSGRNLVNDVR